MAVCSILLKICLWTPWDEEFYTCLPPNCKTPWLFCLPEKCNAIYNSSWILAKETTSSQFLYEIEWDGEFYLYYYSGEGTVAAWFRGISQMQPPPLRLETQLVCWTTIHFKSSTKFTRWDGGLSVGGLSFYMSAFEVAVVVVNQCKIPVRTLKHSIFNYWFC